MLCYVLQCGPPQESTWQILEMDDIYVTIWLLEASIFPH